MAATHETSIEEQLKKYKGILLDVGCGPYKQPGFVGMDIRPYEGVDIVHDWNQFPWPFEDESVLTVVASHVVEHVNPADGHFLRWMDEVWRILKFDGQIAISYPYAGTTGFWQDPTHCNGCTEATWHYWDPEEPDLYLYYRARPFKIQTNLYHREGNGEVVMQKIPMPEEQT